MSTRTVKRLEITDADGDVMTVERADNAPGSLAFRMPGEDDSSTVYVDRDDATTLVRYLTNWLDRTAPEPGEDGGTPGLPPTPDEGDN